MVDSAQRGVVVGIDGSAHAEQALEWAAGEAALRGVPLRIAHSGSLASYPVPEQDRAALTRNIAEASDGLLHEAEQRVRARYGELEVQTSTLSEDAVPGLIGLAGRAELMVVGSRGLNSFSSMLIGSVSQSLVAHAPCPVVVLRGAPTTAAPTDADVVAGAAAVANPVVLGAGHGEAAAPVGFAFAEAARRGVPLRVVRGWRYPPSYGGFIPFPIEDTGLRDQVEAEDLQEQVAAVRKEFPDVRVDFDVSMNEPAWVLVDASARAALVVIGANRGRRRFALPVGRVAQQVLHHAACPVAVVPHH